MGEIGAERAGIRALLVADPNHAVHDLDRLLPGGGPHGLDPAPPAGVG